MPKLTTPPDHVGRQPKRCRYGYQERIFADAWAEENRRRPGINHGLGALDHLLNPITGAGLHLTFERPFKAPTQRDCMVAATVIQWLGTNCGGAFLTDVNRRIEDARVAHHLDFIRDQENPCFRYYLGAPEAEGNCEGDGHPLCEECVNKREAAE